MFNKSIYLLFAVLLVTIYACSNNPKTTTKPANKGKAIYKQYCVTCHGANGKLGLNAAFDLSVSTLSVAEAKLIVSNGRKMMAPYKSLLTPEEIEAVSAYLLELRQ
jgi:cytochrome c6